MRDSSLPEISLAGDTVPGDAPLGFDFAAALDWRFAVEYFGYGDVFFTARISRGATAPWRGRQSTRNLDLALLL